LTSILRLICGTGLLLFALASPAAAPPAIVMAEPVEAPREFRLQLRHIHTGESLDVVYHRGDSYLPEALDLLNHHLRDHFTGEEAAVDIRLFDLLADLSEAVGHPGGLMEVICGYRSPGTNALLRQHSSGVAEHSLHMQAMAVDIRMPGVKTSVLRNAARALQRGGVGYYPGSDFIHVDVGRVRSW
jgi:uncharacterized protein YcbK (DUF882 family)